MLFVRFDRGLYAYVFLGLFAFCHGFAIYDSLSAATILAPFVTLASFVLCMRMCQDEGYGYLAGLENVGRRHAVAHMTITALLLMPIFLLLHVFCIVISLIGFFAGREF